MASDYEVGYGRPPKHTRFKKGQSGNPRGRPKGRKNRGSVVREAIEREVTIRENGKTRKVTVFEALVESMVSKALKGSINDQIKLIGLIEKHVPEKLKDIRDEISHIRVELVASDGNGRPANKRFLTDQYQKRQDIAVSQDEEDPDLIAAWKATGIDDETEAN